MIMIILTFSIQKKWMIDGYVICLYVNRFWYIIPIPDQLDANITFEAASFVVKHARFILVVVCVTMIKRKVTNLIAMPLSLLNVGIVTRNSHSVNHVKNVTESLVDTYALNAK